MVHFDHEEIERHLSYERCIPVVRRAMIDVSRNRINQLPRAVVELSRGRLLGVMAGDTGRKAYFGAKVLSVFHENPAAGRSTHQGLVVVFDPDTGSPVCTADAHAITAIRTAAASAAATDALARADATRLTILGSGEQALRHAAAISEVRSIASVAVWGRSYSRAASCARQIECNLGIEATACRDVRSAVKLSDVICTVSGATDPILLGKWVQNGVHINAVGSSLPTHAEIDSELVARSRFVADSRENVSNAGGEFVRARKAKLVSEEHIVAEIGEIYDGKVPGRQSIDEITVYKSLGHIVQDLAAAACMLDAGRGVARLTK